MSSTHESQSGSSPAWEAYPSILTQSFLCAHALPCAGSGTSPLSRDLLAWLEWEECSLRPAIYRSLTSPQYSLDEVLNHLDTALQHSFGWVLKGTAATIVDCVLFAAFQPLPASTITSKSVQAWLSSCGQQPAIQQALQQVSLFKPVHCQLAYAVVVIMCDLLF